MALFTPLETYRQAQAAGFHGQAARTITAIAGAESSYQTQGPDNINSGPACGRSGSRDRGILQINDACHPEVTDACAYDPSCAFHAAYAISGGGVDFSPWSSYKAGTHLPFLKQLEALLGAAGDTVVSAIGRWLSPFVGSAPITQPFGPTNLTVEPPYAGYPHFHEGIDFGVPEGTPVQSVAAGRVLSAGPLGGYGNAIEVDLGNGLTTLYGHLSRILVSPGQSVAGGTTLGLSGSTGVSTGPHLHFGVQQNGFWVDPASFLYGAQGATGTTFGSVSGKGAPEPGMIVCVTPAKPPWTDWVELPKGGSCPAGYHPVSSSPTPGSVGVGSTPAEGGTDPFGIGSALRSVLTSVFPQGIWTRVLLGTAGVLALIAGLFVLANSATGGDVGEAAKVAAL